MIEDRFKVRVFDTEEEEMVFDAQATYDNGCNGRGVWTEAHYQDVLLNDRYIKMQCSGENDKLGSRIYDGDIVKRQNRYIGQVIFKRGCFKILWLDGVHYSNARHIDDYQAGSLEVIGNIYENSNLLESR